AVQRQPVRPAVLPANCQRGATTAGGDVSRKDPDLAIAAGNRPALWRPRSHHRFARRAENRRPRRQRHGAGRRDRDSQTAVAGIAITYWIARIATSCPAREN